MDLSNLKAPAGSGGNGGFVQGKGREGLPFPPCLAGGAAPERSATRVSPPGEDDHWSLDRAAFTASKFGRSFGVAVCSA